MNDRLIHRTLAESLGCLSEAPIESSALPEACSSPSVLLQKLGVGNELFLLRLRGHKMKNGFFALNDLEDNILEYGPANLAVRVGKRFMWLRLRDVNNGNDLRCITLEYSHQARSFFFWMCLTNSQNAFPLYVKEMWQLEPGFLSQVPSYRLTLISIGEFPELCL